MIERSEWGSALQAVATDKIVSLTKELAANWQVRPKAIPQAGLGMLKLTDSAYGEPFYLGEFPLSTAWLEVETPEGIIAEGAAQIMADHLEQVQALALCDAILAARLSGWEQVDELLTQGVASRDRITKERSQLLIKTQVNFALLDEAGENDA